MPEKMADADATRSRSDSRKELESYFKPTVFKTLANKTITQEFERFLPFEGFKDMLFSTTKTIVSEVVCVTQLKI